MSKNLSQSIEAILFATSEPQSFASLASRLNASKEEVKDAIQSLQTSFLEHGITVVTDGENATLSTKPEQSDLIETIRKEELNKELTKATAETLAVVVYHPGATKAEIEFIRGVNASYSLRALQIRGLIEQRGGGRSTAYYPTLEALRHFGVEKTEDLPNFAETKAKIDSLLEKEKEVTSNE